MAKERNLQALRTSSDLALPLKMGECDAEEKLMLGRRETAIRVLEILEVTQGEHGERYGEGLVEVLSALSGVEYGQEVWEEGVKRVLQFLGRGKLSIDLCSPV
jgi:hypothetical protein